MKYNLPVVLLSKIILLPHNELKIELDGSSNVVEVSEALHDNKVFIVSDLKGTERKPKIESLPLVGVIGEIVNKIYLPNNKVRITLKALKRAEVIEYFEHDMIDSFVKAIKEKESLNDDILINKLKKETEQVVKKISYISNSVLKVFENFSNLAQITDVLATSLISNPEVLNTYLKEYNAKNRTLMLLEYFTHEKQVYELETDIDTKVLKKMGEEEKNFFLKEKIKHIQKELGDIPYKDREVIELREKFQKFKGPNHIKDRFKEEINRYEHISATSPELSMAKDYIDLLFSLPWNKKSIENKDLNITKNILDQTHYGLEKVKTRIIEFLAVSGVSKNIKSPILCLAGPPGVGKTTLAYSIASSLNKEFVKMSVGGVTDESIILGHRKAYIGSNPGRIIASMKKVKVSNPVFLIDEIDKLGKGSATNALLEVLDKEQNKHFIDHYLDEEFDLSNVLFITTANYIENIDPTLKDRLEIIEISGYTEYEKLDIAKNYLLPKIYQEHNLEFNLNISDEEILNIIKYYTKEAGVRELERLLTTIVRKIVTRIVLNENVSLTVNELESYIGVPKYRKNIMTPKIGLVNGLAYTYYGGDTLPIEVTFFKGTGQLILTGSLGNTIKESAQIALSYIKANYKLFNINYDTLIKSDIHIHIPEEDSPKDGPSAGITLTTALISALTNLEINPNIAMTGEMTLRGNILPVGGLKEKCLGAYSNGINKIIIPYDNLRDLEEIPNQIKNKIEFLTVKNYEDILEIIRS